MSIEKHSPDGSPIYRYDDAKPKDFTPAFGNEENIESISNHIEKHVGPIEMVFHEIISDLVHIDVHWVKPSADFPFHTLITSGMSDMPMAAPEGAEAEAYMELCVLLPESWPVSEEAFKDENNYWPIRWLKLLARFPHEYDTWLGYGHTMPNGGDAGPFAGNTELGCMLLLPSLSLGMPFHELKISEEKTIRFYCLYPLYKEEMNFKLKKGSNALIDKFEKYQVTDVIDINRKNTCAKKRWFGLW